MCTMDNKAYYLDYAATAPMSEATFTAMLPFFKEQFANPSSVHRIGLTAKMAVENARSDLASCIYADAKEIYFTSGGTESDNLALRMGAKSREHRGRHLIASAIEHPAVLNTLEALKNDGFEITYIPVDRWGRISYTKMMQSIREDTILISVMAANHEVGSLQPIAEIGQMAKEREILFHTDAVQAFGHIPVDVREWSVDMLSVSAHKLGGPKGVGFLYVNQSLSLKAMITGGGQERGLRSGTENVAGIVGFAAAAVERCEHLQESVLETTKIRDYMIECLLENIPNCQCSALKSERLPGIVHILIPGMETHELVLALSQKNLYVSAGSACHSHDPKPSHVLKAMGRSHKDAYSGLRLSFDKGLTKTDVDEIVRRIRGEVCRIG